MIEAENLYKAYGSLDVLKGVSLKVREGEVVSIVGASGAGKSTLLHILGTLDVPTSGSASIAGTSLLNMKDKALAAFRNKHIGFIFQFHHLLPEFTALENIMIPAFLAKTPKSASNQEAIRLLDLMGLGMRRNHRPNELSGGEQQRVAVARALINKPSVVLADEPSGNLDSDTSKELHQLFFDLRDELGQTFMIVTHNQELADMADRKLVMQDGVIV